MSHSNFKRNPSHSFDIELAASIGVHEAILVEHFRYWIHINMKQKKNFHEGRTWMYQTREDMAAHFPYFSEDQLRRLTDKLVKEGILIKGNFNKTSFDRTIWYAFNNESEFLNNYYDWQNCQMEKANLPNQNGQNARPIPDTNTYPKENNKPPPHTPPIENGGAGGAGDEKLNELNIESVKFIDPKGKETLLTGTQIYRHFLDFCYPTSLIIEAIKIARDEVNPVTSPFKYLEAILQRLSQRSNTKKFTKEKVDLNEYKPPKCTEKGVTIAEMLENRKRRKEQQNEK